MQTQSDDTHKRWKGADPASKVIWSYFDKVIAPKIVVKSLNEKGSPLALLYWRLALARAQCEWIKSYVSNNKIENLSNEMIDEIFKNNLFVSYPNGYANFMLGPSRENMMNNVDSWGEIIFKLANERRIWDFVDGSIGLSIVSGWYLNMDDRETFVSHPAGSVIHKLEVDFQLLCKTDNLFEYFTIASRLMFALSNFRIIERGSAAVNSWIFDIIANEKFNLTEGIRPLLYDWIAFFDTPEQYISFYVISASVNYIKTLNKIKEIDEISVKLLNIMMENPNTIDNLKKREDLWNELKSIVNNAIENNNELNDLEKRRLRDIASGNLVFRKPSKQAENIVKTMLSGNAGVKNLELLSIEDKAYFKELLEFKYNPDKIFTSSLGVRDKEEKNNCLWPDSELLIYQFDQDLMYKVMMHFDIYSTSQNVTQEKQNEKEELAKKIDYIMKNPICMWGFIDPTTINQYTKLLQLSLNIEEQVSIALKNGMNLNQINDYVNGSDTITKRDIEIVTCRAVIMLYKIMDNISLKDLVLNSSKETEMNILRLVANKYCNEDNLETINDDGIRNCLLNYLNPCLFNYVKLSDLIGHSEQETKMKILSVYFKHYNFTGLDMEKCSKNITHILNTIMSHDMSSNLSSLQENLNSLLAEKEKYSRASASTFYKKYENPAEKKDTKRQANTPRGSSNHS